MNIPIPSIPYNGSFKTIDSSDLNNSSSRTDINGSGISHIPSGTTISSGITLSSDITFTADTYQTTSMPADWHLQSEWTTSKIDKEPTFRLGRDAELLTERLERIEAALGITTRNPVLETIYPELSDAGKNMDCVIRRAQDASEVKIVGATYITLTQECEIMEKLKSNNDPE